jgi:hypothetical protein
MFTRSIVVLAALGAVLSASAVFAQCGCGPVVTAPVPVPAVTYYSPVPYASYYAPAAPYVSYYSPYATYYAAPIVRPYAAYYARPVWGVYARPRFYTYRPVVIW